MSLVNKIFTRSQQAMQNAGHKDVLTIKSGALTDVKVIGVIDVEQEISPDALLGDDPRARTILRLIPPWSLLAIEDGSLISDGATTWKVTRRENNAATITVDYFMEQQI